MRIQLISEINLVLDIVDQIKNRMEEKLNPLLEKIAIEKEYYFSCKCEYGNLPHHVKAYDYWDSLYRDTYNAMDLVLYEISCNIGKDHFDGEDYKEWVKCNIKQYNIYRLNKYEFTAIFDKQDE